MSRKNNLRQQQLWMPPMAPDGLALPAAQRRTLTAALADLLRQFASVSGERKAHTPGGYDGHAEPPQDRA